MFARTRRVAGRFFGTDVPFNRRFGIWATVVLYGWAAIALLVGVLLSDEWKNKYISSTFLLLVIVFPFLSIAIAFGIQIVALFLDMQGREKEIASRVQFFSALEKCRSRSAISGSFLLYLLQDWSASMTKLESGIMTIQSDYWRVCAELYAFASHRVECTSLVDLRYWDETDEEHRNDDLIAYKKIQLQKLVMHGIVVNRTFLLRSTDVTDTILCDLFLRIANEQMTDGFRIYFLVLDEVDEELRKVLAKDLSLIDDKILMVGRISAGNRNVYHYDFFDLAAASGAPAAFQPALDLFVDPGKVIERTECTLKLTVPRKHILEFPRLSEPKYLAQKQAFAIHARKLDYWPAHHDAATEGR